LDLEYSQMKLKLTIFNQPFKLKTDQQIL